jgi:tetratricopeptide (TPR) repeat protein
MILAASLLAASILTAPVSQGSPGDAIDQAQAIPLPTETTTWVRARSEHFDIISTAGERRTREIADELETFAAELTKLHPRFKARADPTRIIIFFRRMESQPYFDLLLKRKNAALAGLFVARQPAGGTMIIDAGGNWHAERTPLHELVHDLLSTGDTRPPTWIEEGLAEYFSASGAPIREHIQILQRRTPIPLDQLFAMEGGSESVTDPLFYAESWAAVSWLVRNPAFDHFLDDVEHGISVEEALRTRYRASLEDLRRAVVAPSRNQLPLPLARFGNAKIDLTPITRADAIYELGSFLGSLPGGEGEGRRFMDAALAADPKHVPTLVALGRYDEAIAAAPENASLYLEASESLLGKAIGTYAETVETYDLPNFRRARTLAEKALALGGDRARGWGDLGTSWIAEDEFANGIEPLRKACELDPRRGDYALHLLALLLRHRDKAVADALFARLEADPRESVVFAARHVLVRERLAEANDLVRDGKLDDAAAILRDASTHTNGPASKHDMERQADVLVATAAMNREIATYNRALEELNRGDRAAALATLKALLETATDETVIEEARKLQRELRKKQ